jgi:outer membrane protein OmpA-like peptidoglycan-associated protein
MARLGLVIISAAGALLVGCAKRPPVTGEVQRADAKLEERLAELDRRLGQLEAELRGQGERLDRLGAAGGESAGRADEAGRQAAAAAAQAREAAQRADRAGSAAAEARAAAERAAEAAGKALDRIGAVEARLARQTATRQAETVLETVVVQYAFDRWDLDPRAQTALGDVLKRLQQDPTILVTLEGFTDSVGPDGYNFELSRKRAEAVRRFIVDRNVGLRRIEHIGFGETHPVADNAAADGRAKNRRVVIKLTAAE